MCSRRPRSLAALLAAFAIALLARASAAAPPPAPALALRDRGIAELENEQPAAAGASFEELARLVPGDPLPLANAAVAALRQQRHAEAAAALDRALALAPGRGDLLALRGDLAQTAGRAEEALHAYRQALAANPRDVETAYALLRQAETVGGAAGEEALDHALGRLAELRPENPLVLLRRGARAIARGDRATATGTYQRLGELLWQSPGAASTALEAVLAPLRDDQVELARVPAMRLENLLRGTPLYQQGLGELSIGVLGRPVLRFREEPAAATFGNPAAVSWTLNSLGGAAARALAVADLDGDQRLDLVALAGERLEVRLAAAGWKAAEGAAPAAAGQQRLLAADLDNDGHWDLLASGGAEVAAWRGEGGGRFAPGAAAFALAGARGAALAALDHDAEGDLDLVVAGGRPGERGLALLRNAGTGALAAAAESALPAIALPGDADVVASDLDRDGDLDLVVAHAGGIEVLANRRQGTFGRATAGIGLADAAGARRVVAADFDGDGSIDLAVAGPGLRIWRNRGGGRFEAGPQLDAGAAFTALVALDADNDGRLDLAAGGAQGVVLFARRADGGFAARSIPSAPRDVAALAAADLDGDGHLDMAVAARGGLSWLENGGGPNHWLAVRLRGLQRGNGKNNVFGLGASLEVRAGAARQLREVHGEVTHIGLGSLAATPVLRVVWTNGVPQNRLQVAGDRTVVEEQVLKGSCPFLYTWDGERVRFVTDLLWNAPLGLPVAEGVWAGADPSELVVVAGAAPRDGAYDLRVTEELWEAAFFDHTRLWVVDHPAAVEVASNLRVLPGQALPERVLASRGLRPVAAAWDGRGTEVTAVVRQRDEVYADGYAPSPYQGVAAAAWALTFDLGEAPAAPVRLHLDGWIFPADASLNLAVAQRGDLAASPPRLEVETAAGWQPLLPAMGFPAGKTKTMVVDTPPLPPGARRLRILTGQWLHWDRVAWTTTPVDDEPRVVARLLPAVAELRARGFSRTYRAAPNGPHHVDYATVSTDSPWLPLPGRYTRYGDVRELLAAPDDRTVILAAGDELALRFDASGLPPPPAGWRRTVFLETHGWDKDADRNTWEAERLEPLPFRAMTGYPYAPGESYPDTPELRRYREEWLTREVPAEPEALPSPAGGAP